MMEEKILITARFKKNILATILMVIGFVFLVCGIIYLESDEDFAVILFIPAVICILISFLLKQEQKKWSLSVTNKSVIGTGSFGKTVYLPLTQISAVGLGIFNGIAIATSSGKVHFWSVENRSEVYSLLTEIIGKVQVDSAYAQRERVTATGDTMN